MRHYFFCSLLALQSFYFSSAQSIDPSGARASGLGNASVTISDEWSSFHNIAGLSAQKRFAAGLWYKNNYATAACSETSVHAVGSLMKGGWVVSFYKSGNEIYSKNNISVGYAHKISLMSLGLQIHYLQQSMEGLGVKKNIAFDLGGIAELIPSKLFFGASIFNFNQTKIKEELLPVIMKAGMSFRPGKKIMLNGEVEKDLLYKPAIKAGIEYSILEKFKIRTGINMHPFVNFFGVGFQNHIFQLDYALSNRASLGYSHSICLLIFFNKKK